MPILPSREGLELETKNTAYAIKVISKSASCKNETTTLKLSIADKEKKEKTIFCGAGFYPASEISSANPFSFESALWTCHDDVRT